MALEGSLRDFGLADILQLIYFQKKTGILTLSGHKDRVRLMFYDGNVIETESLKRPEDQRVGKILLKKGLISNQDLRAGLEEQRTSGERLGTIFLRKELLPLEDLRQTLLSQMTETVVQLFSWKEGTYEFQSETLTANRDLPITLDTQHLLMEGLRVIDEWSLVEGKVTLNTVFRRTEQTEAMPTADEEDILRFVDGENDVSMIIELSGIEDFQVSRMLIPLMERGIIEPVGAQPVVSEIAAAGPVTSGRTYPAYLIPLAFAASLFLSLVVLAVWGSGPRLDIPSLLAGEAHKKLATMTEIDRLRFLAQAHKYRVGSYPAGLAQIGNARDAWGRPYIYTSTDDDLTIISAGPDGAAGTDDDIF